jgi:CBS domain-containing protein
MSMLYTRDSFARILAVRARPIEPCPGCGWPPASSIAQENMLVSQILKKKGTVVATTRPKTAILTVAQMMAYRKIGAVVVTSDDGRVLGIISERDVARCLASHGVEALDSPVSDFMTHAVRTCSPQGNIRQIMADMTNHRLRHLPVVDGHRLCGMISIGDVVKSLLDDMELEVNVLRDASVTSR